MKIILLTGSMLVSIFVYSQDKLFKVYTDSAFLVNDANKIVDDFVDKVNAVSPVFTTKPLAILNTKPYLIFYSPKANQVNLPIWHQVMPQQKEFFTNIAGSEKEGEKVFALFFNGFYLSHELGHALQNAANIKAANQYENEYFANQVAVLYWRKANRKKELKQCYKYAKKMVAQLKDPVPAGEDPIRYFTENYSSALASDPYKYGYFQFNQLVKIYEDKKLKKFDDFIKGFLLQ